MDSNVLNTPSSTNQQCDFRLVYLDISQDNKQELRLSQKEFTKLPNSLIKQFKAFSKDTLPPLVTSLDLSNN